MHATDGQDEARQGTAPPLAGVVVLDLSRMLPGAVLARTLLDLGARVIKVESPDGGDPLRAAPPLVDGIGAPFCAFFRGAESVALDIRDEAGAATVLRLVPHADVLVESFRPGALAAWGLGEERLRAANPGLVTCSLTGYGEAGEWRRRAGHDLNFAAVSGLLSQLGGAAVPRVQIADVAGGLLAACAILAALVGRRRSGLGCHIDQPLAAAPLPFVLWAWAEAAIGGDSTLDALLAGACPAYRLYACGDGRVIAVAALEPKFWLEFVTLLGLDDLAFCGLASGPEGARVMDKVGRRLLVQPRQHWLELCQARGLPVSAVHDIAEASSEPMYAAVSLLERTPLPGGTSASLPGPFVPALGRPAGGPAPRLGEHTAAVLSELGGAAERP